MLEEVIDFIFPPNCFGCGASSAHFCQSCLDQCPKARHLYCLVCDEPSNLGQTHAHCLQTNIPLCIYSAFEYKDLVRECIMRSKYKAKLFAPLKVMSQEATRRAVEHGKSYEDHVVVPIPLSAKRSRERGFNQAAIIAQAAATTFSLTCQESLLARSKDTKAQHKKTRQGRFENLKGAFIAKKGAQNAKILLVDDICTTGATLLEAAKTLYRAGAKEIRCFTLAKEF